MKKILLALLAAALFWATPAAALTTTELDGIFSRTPECKLSDLSFVKTTRLNGGYAYPELGRTMGYPGAAIRIWTDDYNSRYTMVVLLHEIGHCIQNDRGFNVMPYDFRRTLAYMKEHELDADRLGALLAIRHGYDPLDALDAFQYIGQLYNFPYNQGTDHGSLNERALNVQYVVRRARAPETM